MASPKLYKRNEVENKNNSQGAWIIIHNSVYNVTEFLNEVSIPRILFNDGVLRYVAYKRIFLHSDLQDRLLYIQRDFDTCSCTLLEGKYKLVSSICVSTLINV
jgi:hypothetical protein